jgi:hypothetical protein
MISTAFSRTLIGIAALAGLRAFSAMEHARDCLKAERPQQRGYSEAMITGGRRKVRLEDRPTTVFILVKFAGLEFGFNRYIRQPIVPWPPAWPTFCGPQGPVLAY